MSHWLRTEEGGQPPRPFRMNAFSGVATNAALGVNSERGARRGTKSANSLAVCERNVATRMLEWYLRLRRGILNGKAQTTGKSPWLGGALPVLPTSAALWSVLD